MDKKVRVAVGMSGGVDSAVAAYLLIKQGYDVVGITMKHWGGIEESGTKTCCSLDDIYDAKRVCDDLGIPHYTVNFQDDFKKIVVKYFVDSYINGNTPNPCNVCNRFIKLGKLIDFAVSVGADYFATGHYAKLIDGKLYMGDDENKDQAYFLAQVRKEYMAKLMFPLGNYKKEEIREIARNEGIRVYSKRDSQEICFIENDDYKAFLKNITSGSVNKAGAIKTTKGTTVGKHNGLAFYTIGQRKGLGISAEKPYFVVGYDLKENSLIVGTNEELMKNRLECSYINLLGVEKIEDLNNMKCKVKTRSRDKLHDAFLAVERNEEAVKIPGVIDDGEIISEYKIIISFDEDVRAVTPGQIAVMYGADGLVLASGFIIK